MIHSPVSFQDDAAHRLHVRLRAIDHNVLISQLKPGQVVPPDETFVKKAELLWQYRDFPEIIRNTERLLQSCSFYFNFNEVKNKKTFTETPTTIGCCWSAMPSTAWKGATAPPTRWPVSG